MKVAFVLLDAQVTGGQIVAHGLIRGLIAAGHEALAIFPQEGEMTDRLRADGIDVAVVTLNRSYRLDQAVELALLFRREHVDLVDTHTLFVGGILARAATTIAGLPLVAHAHIEERFHPSSAIRVAQRSLDRASSGACSATIAVSSYVRRHLIAHGADPRKVVVVHNGVHLGESAAPTPNETLNLLCVARLAPVKGQETFLRALAATDGSVRASFVGVDLEHGGAYLEHLRGVARDVGVAGRVEFLGGRDDVRALMAGSDALVLPSCAEGLPLVVLEAMAEARAVIATNVGGTSEAVADGETGYLVPVGDQHALARAIARLVSDRTTASALGQAGRQRAERLFTVDRMVNRTLAVYEGITSPSPSPSPSSSLEAR